MLTTVDKPTMIYKHGAITVMTEIFKTGSSGVLFRNINVPGGIEIKLTGVFIIFSDPEKIRKMIYFIKR